MEVFRAYAFATSGYLALQALPLLLAPRVVLLLASTEPRATTDLEAYLSRSLGLAFLVLALLILLLTGAIPLKDNSNSSSNNIPSSSSHRSSNSTSSSSSSPYNNNHGSASSSSLNVSFVAPTSSDEDRLASPFTQATLVITTTYHACTAFYLYTRMTLAWGSLGLGGGWLVSLALFGVGIWVLVFGGEQARISLRTGADKRTSNYPFENKESAREKKKERNREDRERDKESSGSRLRKSILRTKSR